MLSLNFSQRLLTHHNKSSHKDSITSHNRLIHKILGFYHKKNIDLCIIEINNKVSVVFFDILIYITMSDERRAKSH